MVSIGPDTQSYNFSHMYLFVDYNGNEPELCVTSGSMYEFLKKDGGFTKFLQVLDKADKCVRVNDIQADCTMFIPRDVYLKDVPNDFFAEMDEGLARQIVASSTLRKKIDGELVTCCPVSYFTTMNPKMRMYVTNIRGKTQINNCMYVQQYDVMCSNGIIHITTGIIVPTNDTFMN